MIKRKANAVWEGIGKTGKGTLTTASTVLNNTPYSFGTRFENGVGTNPEELVAAAHAGCFTMKLAFNLEAAGFVPTQLSTQCVISFDNGVITASDLTIEAKIPEITVEKFNELLADAEKNCPISQLFKAQISATGVLV